MLTKTRRLAPIYICPTLEVTDIKRANLDHPVYKKQEKGAAGLSERHNKVCCVRIRWVGFMLGEGPPSEGREGTLAGWQGARV